MSRRGWPPDLPLRIDHTLLRPEATRADVRRHCEDARRYGFGTVFVHPCYLADAVRALAGAEVRIGTPIGFPYGAQTTRVKVLEAEDACGAGAQELDMVLNIGLLKSGEHDAVQAEIAAVVAATPGAGHKVILETGCLTEAEIRAACLLVVQAGADSVKTCTGVGPRGATVEDVRLMRTVVGRRAKVKAAGGIRDLTTVRALLEAGADRIGTSAGAAITEEWLGGG